MRSSPEGYSGVTGGNIFYIATYLHTVFILLHGQSQLVATYSWISRCHDDVIKICWSSKKVGNGLEHARMLLPVVMAL